MSRVVLYSMGYRGDVLPFVPVARELARRDHDVRFVCPREFHPLFRDEPFTSIHSGTDFGPELLDQHAAFVARWGSRFGGALLPRLYFDKLTIPTLDTLFEVLDAELEDADVVASHPFPHLVARPAAERRGVLALVLDLFPMLVPSRHTALPGAPRLPATLNAAGWALMRSSLAQRFPTFAKIRRFQAERGADVDDWSFLDACRASSRTIGLFSRHYYPPRPDWPASYHVAGFTPWLGPEGQVVAADVRSFLDAGDPPVIVTLGTNAASAHPEWFVAAADALTRAGRRAIVLASNAPLAHRLRLRIGSEHGVWPFVPLGPLLEHSEAVVHAGGHSTNAAALTAGLPMAIMPAVTDQRWHARRIEQLGVGVRVKRGGVDKAVDALVTRPVFRERARAFAQVLAAENGPAQAADLIDSALGHRR